MSKKILKYDEKAMQDALVAVKQKTLSVKSAAKTFNVPKTTLYYKVTGKYPEKRQMGPKTNLLEEEEKLIVTWMFQSADRGFPITKSQLLDSIEMYIKKINRKTSFKDGKPGDKWFKLFMRRHPEVSSRMTQNLGKARSSITEESLRQWFDAVLKELTDCADVLEDPSRVFNADETAIFLAPKGEKVLVRKGEKAVYLFTCNDEKECLTCLIGSNALGQLMPPMVVFKYERLPSAIINELPNNWAFGRTDSGWMTSESFFEYIANIFYPWLINQNIKLPVALFVDGHSSHLTYTLSQFCSQNGIHLIALHPNATHVIQPMDVAVFRPLKEHWRKAVHSFKINNLGGKIKRENFAPLMDSVLKQLKTESIVNGFRCCGIYPFDKNAVNYGKYFKDNVVKQNATETISKEMMRIHYKFLQKRIGLDKVAKFENNDIENGDESLYQLWKELKEDCDIEPINRTATDELEVNTNGIHNNFNGNDSPNLEKQRRNEKEEKETLGSKENNHLHNIKNNNDAEAKKDASYQEISTSRPYTTSDQLPSPFKNVFILPETKVTCAKKRQVTRELMPSVISGEHGKQYFKKKEEERERKELEKTERKKKRENVKLMTEK